MPLLLTIYCSPSSTRTQQKTEYNGNQGDPQQRSAERPGPETPRPAALIPLAYLWRYCRRGPEVRQHFIEIVNDASCHQKGTA